MTHTHLADCLSKLKETAPESADFILNRSEEIADERLKQRSLEAIARTPIHMWRGMALGMSAMFGSVSKQDYRIKQREALQDFKQNNSVNSSFDWAFENVRLAMVEYVLDNDIQLNTFNDQEQGYLFPNGIPSRDLNPVAPE